MAPNSPECSFVQASMAGSRSTAPLNRSNSDLTVAPLCSFEIYGYVAYTRRPPDRGDRRELARKLSLPPMPFVVVYRILTHTIEIANVIHGAQKWPQED